jgi:hypothetical protein
MTSISPRTPSEPLLALPERHRESPEETAQTLLSRLACSKTAGDGPDGRFWGFPVPTLEQSLCLYVCT